MGQNAQKFICSFRKVEKSSGQDNITLQMIKYMGEVPKKELCQLLNDMLKGKEIPKD